METLLLLQLISLACLCGAGFTHHDIHGFPIRSDENIEYHDSDEGTDNGPSCGMFSGDRLRMAKSITIGGTNTKYLEFPWMVAIFVPKSKSRQCRLKSTNCWRFKCGGSLISSKVVLTAGHCVYYYRQSKLKARAGDWNLDTFEEPYSYQERLISKTVVHSSYYDSPSGKWLKYDAALLIAESAYTPANNIGNVCLPPSNFKTDSASCKVAGWGVQTGLAHNNQQLLHVVDLDYMDHDRCQRLLRKNLRSSFVLHGSFTCAGGVRGKDACQADGGSPLMCIAEDHYYVRGITSWGVGCGKENLPGAYTDIVKVRGWIDRTMKANGFSTNTYTHVA